MHTAGYIHRDVKPANVMLQPSDALGETKVLLVDFGLSRKYCDAHGKHCPAKQAQPGKFRGTTAYASIHSHRGESENEREKEKEKEKEKEDGADGCCFAFFSPLRVFFPLINRPARSLCLVLAAPTR